MEGATPGKLVQHWPPAGKTAQQANIDAQQPLILYDQDITARVNASLQQAGVNAAQKTNSPLVLAIEAYEQAVVEKAPDIDTAKAAAQQAIESYLAGNPNVTAAAADVLASITNPVITATAQPAAAPVNQNTFVARLKNLFARKPAAPPSFAATTAEP